MTKRWGYVAIAGLVVLNLAILALTRQNRLFHLRLERLQIDETPPDYHSLVEPAIIEKLERTVGSDWRYIMLAFVSASGINPRLKYLDVLHERYASRGLKIIGVFNGSEWRTRQLNDETEVGFPVISDEEFQLHRAAHIHPSHQHGGVVVLDRQGRIDFHTLGVPAEDQLRQLAEKYALGEVSYDPVEERLTPQFKVGAPLPELMVSSIDGREHFKLGGAQAANLALVIFNANCSSCQIDQFINELGTFQNKLTRENPHRRLVVVFTPNYDQGMLASYQRVGKLPASSYLIEKGTSWYDEYATRYDTTATRPTIVMTGRSGEIVAVNSL